MASMWRSTVILSLGLNTVQLYGAATSTNAPIPLDARVIESVTAVLNNPPYGEPGGLAGAISCSTNSPSKTWVDCELSQVGGVVTFRINGWPALTYTNTSDVHERLRHDRLHGQF